MTLHLDPQERAVYDKERNRQRSADWRDKRAAEARQREARYQRLEEQNHALVLKNEQFKTAFIEARDALLELQANPPVRIETKTVIEKVPTLFDPKNIHEFMKNLWYPADNDFRGELLRGQEDAGRMKGLIRCPKCGHEEGPFIKP